MASPEEGRQARGNWGRWGDNDQRGALNLLTPDHVLAAAAAIKQGRTISLGIPLDMQSTPVYPMRPPVLHAMLLDGATYASGTRRAGTGFQYADDYVAMAVHTGTHVDALAHVGHAGLMYNGFSAGEVRTPKGARRLGIERFGGALMRGVLLDVAAAEQVPALDDGFVITDAVLERVEAVAGVTVSPGDAVLIRTGWMEQASERTAAPDWHEREPGIDVSGAHWLAERDVVVVGCDNFAVEALPAADREPMPVHLELLFEHGIYIVEFLNLAPLAEEGVKDFAFAIAPLPLVGAVGSPVNPLAIL